MASVQRELMQAIEAAREELFSLTRRLVQAETVNTGDPDSGHEDLVADIVEAAFAGTKVETKRYTSRPGRANIIARLPGKSGRLGLAFLAHSDVVAPGNAANWTYPAFAAETSGNRMYGRGTSDMKGYLAGEIMALQLLERAGYTPNDDIVLICAADEENGGTYGMKFLVEKHSDQVRAKWAVNEGGSVYQINGQPCYGIGLGDKGRWRVTYKLHGRSAHASQPWNGDNVLFKLQNLLSDIQDTSWPRQFQLRFYRDVQALVNWGEELTSQNFDRFLEYLAEESPQLVGPARALAANTIAPTMVEAGVGSNVIPDSANLVCDVRLLPGADVAMMADTLQALADKYRGTELEISPTAQASISPASDPFFASVQDATQLCTGLNPSFIGALTSGFTDARFLRGLGVTVYNYAPVAANYDATLSRIHGPDESISLDDLIIKAKFYAVLPTVLPGP